MFMSSLQSALLFTISVVFNTYIIIVLFRFMLQLVRSDSYGPLGQLATKITNPLLMPLQKVIPKYKQINFAALVLALILQTIQILLLLTIQGFSIAPSSLSVGGLFIWSFGELIDVFLVFILFTTLIQVVFSWIQPGQYNPGVMLFVRITEPFLSPIRRILPDIGMLDFSPMVLIFLVYLMRIMVASPIIAFGRGMI